jgi:hypothetical protein
MVPGVRDDEFAARAGREALAARALRPPPANRRRVPSQYHTEYLSYMAPSPPKARCTMMHRGRTGRPAGGWGQIGISYLHCADSAGFFDISDRPRFCPNRHGIATLRRRIRCGSFSSTVRSPQCLAFRHSPSPRDQTLGTTATAASSAATAAAMPTVAHVAAVRFYTRVSTSEANSQSSGHPTSGETAMVMGIFLSATVAILAGYLAIAFVISRRRRRTGRSRPGGGGAKRTARPPPRRLRSFDVAAGAADDACPICLGALREERCSVGPCGTHAAHTGCLERWVRLDASCPVCRVLYGEDEGKDGCVEEEQPAAEAAERPAVPPDARQVEVPDAPAKPPPVAAAAAAAVSGS